VAQGVGPEFKPQYHKKKKKEEEISGRKDLMRQASLGTDGRGVKSSQNEKLGLKNW
jgi:hypothetical protein